MSSENHSHHIVPLRIYLFIGMTLLVMTAVTVWASYIDLGAWNVVVALLIAGVKATLVILYFMHLRYDNKLYAIIFLVAIAFLTIFIGLVMFDTLHRGDLHEESEFPINDKAIIYQTDVDTTGAIPDSLNQQVSDSLLPDSLTH